MTREEARRGFLADCDRALNHQFLIGADTVARVKALRELLVTSDPVMDQLVTIMRGQRGDPGEAPSGEAE
jgi:hypothetical protein